MSAELGSAPMRLCQRFRIDTHRLIGEWVVDRRKKLRFDLVLSWQDVGGTGRVMQRGDARVVWVSILSGEMNHEKTTEYTTQDHYYQLPKYDDNDVPC